MSKKEFIHFYDREVLQYLESEKGRSFPLPSISIACAPKCNLACPHCIYDAKTESVTNSFTLSQKVEILQQAQRLGAKFLQICHEGEPFVDNGVMPLIQEAAKLGMDIFLYTNATMITAEIAKELYDHKVCLGVKCDSLNPSIFNKMLGRQAAALVYRGIQNLLEAGYDQPFEKNGKLYTRMGLVCTLTSLNTENIEDVKDVARFAWKNKIFFGAARLERGGRATGRVWEALKIPDQDKVVDFIDWCSVQTGINYWDAQPTPYCIGVCGVQVADSGEVWITRYGGSCDFTEPDGESYPENLVTAGNLRDESLKAIVTNIWNFRRAIVEDGTLDEKLAEYEQTKDVYPNGLQDCGSARTYTLFVPFYHYVKQFLRR